MEQFNIWAFLGGLAMFVFGMDVLESCIHDLGYNQLKKFLAKTVNTRLRAMFAGTVLAGILQSGTIVSLMVLAFAGAGMLSLVGAIGVIVGANVGGTFLGVIIAKLGFEYSISAFALPLLGIGGILQFVNYKKVKLIGKLILGFGLLLFGIGYLKDSVSILAAGLDVGKYANMGWYAFYLGGAVLALLLHSSGTATIVAMTAMQAGILTFDQAVVTMLGASIGSSLVSVYASVGGSAIKRQVALAHFGFNTFGAVLFLFFVPWTQEFMELFMNTTGDSGPTAIAWFQVVYNVATGILIYPFIGALGRMFERYFSKEHADYRLYSINVGKNYTTALEKDIMTLVKKIYKFNVHHLDIDQKILLNVDYTISEKYYAIYHLSNEELDEDYDILKTIEEGVLRELLKRIHQGDNEQDKLYLGYYELIEMMMYGAKTLHDTRENFMMLSQSDSLMIKERLQYLKEQMVDLYLIISQFIAGTKTIKEEELRDVVRTIDHNNLEITNLIGQHLHRQSMPGGELSALLHLISALQRSHHAMIEVVKKLPR